MNFKTALLISSTLIALSPIAAMAQTAAPATAAEAAEAAAKKAAEPVAERDAELIVVTASGRREAATRVPYNISAISEETLRNNNIVDFKDLIQNSIAIDAPANSARFADSVTVRGLNISSVSSNNIEFFARSTLSTYLDSTSLPNIGYRIKDIARVEQLLGPQGTLYGAGSLGGTVRYITNQPKLGEYEGRLSTSIYQTMHGGISTDTDLMVNVPLGETAALRLSLAYLDEAGFTDRVSNPPWRTGTAAWVTRPDPQKNLYKDDDYQEVTGGKLTFLWAPTDKFKLTLSHAMQAQLAHGTTASQLLPCNVANATTPTQLLNAVNRNSPRGCTGPTYFNAFDTPFAVNDRTVLAHHEEYADRDFALTSLDLEYDLGFGILNSSTSFFKDTRVGQGDYTGQGWFFYCALGYGPCLNETNDTSYITFDNAYEGLAHETRLTSTSSGPLSYILGLYYTNQKRRLKYEEIVPTMDAFIGTLKAIRSPTKDSGYSEDVGGDYTETALFGELTWSVTDRLRLTAGARVFGYEDKTDLEIIDYVFDLVSGDVNTKVKDSGKAYYKINAAFDLTDSLLAYATLSQGFRRGGVNGFRNLSSTQVVRPDIKEYQPDSTDNYELGLKGYLFDRRLYLEAAIYQINWKDTQTYYAQDFSGVPVWGTTNGPDSRTRGFEVNSRFNFNKEWSVSYAAGTTEGEFVGTREVCTYLANNGADDCRSWNKGGKLGGAAEWKHTAGINFTRILPNGSEIRSSFMGRYVSEVQNDRCDTPTDCSVKFYPAFSRFNTSAGWSNDTWDVSIWITNLTNTRELVSQSPERVLGRQIVLTQPRTMGLNISYKWN
jgi:iron complex outermembrane recepter protein